MSLHAIAYASSASKALTKNELRALRDEWFELYANAGVTGLVFHRDGSFIGYLEGEADPLTKVFAAIRLDPRHYLVTVVLNEPCEHREFDSWTMGNSLPVEAKRKEPGEHRAGRDLLRAMWTKSR